MATIRQNIIRHTARLIAEHNYDAWCIENAEPLRKEFQNEREQHNKRFVLSSTLTKKPIVNRYSKLGDNSIEGLMIKNAIPKERYYLNEISDNSYKRVLIAVEKEAAKQFEAMISLKGKDRRNQIEIQKAINIAANNQYADITLDANGNLKTNRLMQAEWFDNGYHIRLIDYTDGLENTVTQLLSINKLLTYLSMEHLKPNVDTFEKTVEQVREDFNKILQRKKKSHPFSVSDFNVSVSQTDMDTSGGHKGWGMRVAVNVYADKERFRNFSARLEAIWDEDWDCHRFIIVNLGKPNEMLPEMARKFGNFVGAVSSLAEALNMVFLDERGVY